MKKYITAYCLHYTDKFVMLVFTASEQSVEIGDAFIFIIFTRTFGLISRLGLRSINLHTLLGTQRPINY